MNKVQSGLYNGKCARIFYTDILLICPSISFLIRSDITRDHEFNRGNMRLHGYCASWLHQIGE